MADSSTIMDEALINVADLGKNYSRRSIVQGVTLRLMPGEIVGLVGANGGGKTTTLRMLAGLVRPDNGTGSVLGTDIARAADVRAQIGYMPQRLSLYPELTVAENLRFRADMFGLRDKAHRLAEVAEHWGLAQVLDRRFEHLSGGWARRVQFAATTVHLPSLLLLDEPTTGLDVVTRNDIWGWLNELAKRGHGIVVSTHDLDEAARCPSILFYRNGVAEQQMMPAELIQRSGAQSLEAAVALLALSDG